MLTVSVSPVSGGSAKVNDAEYTGSIRFTQYSTVTLEVVPAEGYGFSHWTGALTGSSNPANLIMSCSKQVTAHFSSLADSASIGNFVWEDKDADGIQDTGEPGIDGVTVNLYDSADNFIKATTTSGGGFSSFNDLEPGSYYLEFIEYAGGYVFSPINQGNNDQVDSDADLTGRTSITTLNHGEKDMSWDAGVYRPTILNYTVQLSSGLNLISLPLVPRETRPQVALDSLDFSVAAMYEESRETFRSYTKTLPPEAGFLWKDGLGYWFDMNGAGTLTFSGSELDKESTTPLSYGVGEGWNLVGFKSTIPREPADYLESIDGKYNIIYGYTDGGFFVAGTEGHELMQPGQGYWIDMIEPGIIFPPLEQIIGNITTEEAHDMIYADPGNPDLVVLDVRTQAEYDSGHIEHVAHLDYYSSTITEDLNNLDKTRTYIVCCRSGKRSGLTLDIMKGHGFREAYNMLGGMLQWIDDGYDVVSSP